MAPNTSRLQTLDAFATIDKTLFIQKNTQLLSAEESAQSEDVFSYAHLEKLLLADAKRREEEEASLTAQSEAEAESEYWGWCNDETAQERRIRENKKLLESLLEEEEARLFFSAGNTIKRLVESKPLSPSTVIESSTKADNDYWTWKSDQDEHLHLFSAQKLHESLVQESKNRAERSNEPIIDSRSNRDDLWEWHSEETATEKQRKDKKELLANILLEEEIRAEFSADTIEKRLIEESKTNQNSVTLQVADVSGGYWDF